MSETRRYGLIGTGMMGREHIQNLALVPETQLVAMMDTHALSLELAQKTCHETGIEGVSQYNDIARMVEHEALDAVIIATPNFTHHEIAADLLKTDIALLVEKPLCTTVADAEALVRLSGERKGLFWTGLEYRYMPPVATFIDRVHAGELGKLQMLSIREHRFPFLPKVGDWNRFSRNTGGTLVEKCCHFFDLMRVIISDDPVKIYASGNMDVNHLNERYDGEMPDILDNAYVIVDFAGGQRAHLDLCMFAEGAEEQEEIAAIGDKAKLEVAIPSGTVTFSPRTGFLNPKQVVREHIKTDPAALSAGHHHGATYYQLLDFHNAMINGTPPTVSALDGLRSVQMGAAAHRSIETRQAVELDFT